MKVNCWWPLTSRYWTTILTINNLILPLKLFKYQWLQDVGCHCLGGVTLINHCNHGVTFLVALGVTLSLLRITLIKFLVWENQNLDHLRDCQQITFITFNRFCPLNKTLYPAPLFLIDNIKMDRIPTTIKWKIHAFTLYFNFLKVIIIKLCKIQPPDLLFLVVFISFYISMYHFSQFFRTSFIKILKKDFRPNFPFLKDSLKPPTPLMTKIC